MTPGGSRHRLAPSRNAHCAVLTVSILQQDLQRELAEAAGPRADFVGLGETGPGIVTFPISKTVSQQASGSPGQFHHHQPNVLPFQPQLPASSSVKFRYTRSGA